MNYSYRIPAPSDVLVKETSLAEFDYIKSSISEPIEVFERIEQLLDKYFFNNADEEIEIINFIYEHKFLIPILEQAPAKIKSVFGEVKSYLSILEDPEDEDFVELFIVIRPNVKNEIATKLLDKLADEWFIDILPQARGSLCITVEGIDEFQLA